MNSNKTPDRGPISASAHVTQDGPGPGYTWKVEIPFAGKWLTANRSSAYRYAARTWRNTVHQACIAAKLPKGITPVRLHFVCWYETRVAPVRDRLNLSPTIKACVDGLSPTIVVNMKDGRRHTRGGYGFLPDDSDKHVLDTSWEVLPGVKPGVDLYITVVTDA